MSTRERLALAVWEYERKVVKMGSGEDIGEWERRPSQHQNIFGMVDAILNELMEPGEGALQAGDDAGIDELTSASEVWEVVLAAVRAGK